MAIFNTSPPSSGKSFTTTIYQDDGIYPALLSVKPSLSIDAPILELVGESHLMEPTQPQQHHNKGEPCNLASENYTGTDQNGNTSTSLTIGFSDCLSEDKDTRTSQKASTLPSQPPAIRTTSRNSAPRATLRTSLSSGTLPLKNQFQSLTLSSKPGITRFQVRPRVKFAIDSRGRARVVNVSDIENNKEEPTISTIVRCQKRNHSGAGHQRRNSSDTDMLPSYVRPTVVPSQNTPLRPPNPKSLLTQYLHLSERYINDHRKCSKDGCIPNGSESKAETVVRIPHFSHGDAASELWKVVKSRRRAIPRNANQGFISGPLYSSARSISPINLTDFSIPTRHTDQGNRIRCSCNVTNSGVDRSSYLVQWYGLPS